MDDSTFFKEKSHKDFQHIIGVCKFLIVAGIFDLAYVFSSLIILPAATRVVHLDLATIIFGYLKKNPIIGYAINPQPLTVDSNYEKFQMKYYSGNQYA